LFPSAALVERHHRQFGNRSEKPARAPNGTSIDVAGSTGPIIDNIGPTTDWQQERWACGVAR